MTEAAIWRHEDMTAHVGFPYGWNLAPDASEPICATDDARSLADAVREIQLAMKEHGLDYPIELTLRIDGPETMP